jgi:hypothetical protein
MSCESDHKEDQHEEDHKEDQHEEEWTWEQQEWERYHCTIDLKPLWEQTPEEIWQSYETLFHSLGREFPPKPQTQEQEPEITYDPEHPTGEYPPGHPNDSTKYIKPLREQQEQPHDQPTEQLHDQPTDHDLEQEWLERHKYGSPPIMKK